MLELKNIVKTYPAGGDFVKALKGVSLKFRNNEFVSILGPSGCGKTTMLNIIGGLDQYTEGDLVINGRSTKEYKDRDWDSYRNHTIGFVFQSYNLIPHQTVLQNVELALTLSGVSKAERKRRATEALEKVGLGNQLKKKPAQMSGGQMQRVAIARAIVNNPDIILADEPTGALDSETSVQVMEILKDIAADRLVIMVTHNPELAEQYSTRIIRMLDGTVQGDSMPITDSEAVEIGREDAIKMAGRDLKKERKAAMSFGTAFGLSLKNLFTKKGRTLLTSFAGSIGIIGIALIMAVSQGTSDYIDSVQEDTLSNYPLSFYREASDMSSMLTGAMTSRKEAENAEAGTLVETPIMSSMFGGVHTNDLAALKKHIDEHFAEISRDVNAIQYSYGVTPLIFTKDVNGNLLQANPAAFMSQMGGGSSIMSSYYSFNVFNEILNDPEILKTQYQVLTGRWPEAYDEMVLVLNSPNQVTDMLTFAVGLRNPEELNNMMTAIMNGENAEVDTDTHKWTYDDFLSMDLRLLMKSDLYRYNEKYDLWEDMSKDADYMEQVYQQGIPLKVVGILCPADGVTTSALQQGFNYLPELNNYVMEQAASSKMVEAQLADETIDVFSGKAFGADTTDKGLNFEDMVTIDEDAIMSAFGGDMGAGLEMNSIQNQMTGALSNIDIAGTVAETDTTGAANDFKNGLKQLTANFLEHRMADKPSENEDGAKGTVLQVSEIEPEVTSYMNTTDAVRIVNELAGKYGVDSAQILDVYRPLLTTLVNSYVLAVNTGLDNGNSEVLPVEESTDTSADSALDPTENAENETQDETAAESSAEETTPELPSIDFSDVALPSETPSPEEIVQEITDNVNAMTAFLPADDISGLTDKLTENALTDTVSGAMGGRLMLPAIQNKLYGSIAGAITGVLSNVMAGMQDSFSFDQSKFADAFKINMDEEELARVMTSMYSSGNAKSAKDNLTSLGYAKEEDPSQISVYLKDFESKEHFISFIDDYNDKMQEEDEDKVITYTDITGVLMSSVTTIINAITYVLIAFVAISLIVSSIMIGVITLISVQERTKEIGILRAIGASKRNVSSLFNAETVIIGFTSGLLGVVITYLLTIPINIILNKLTKIDTLRAMLPIPAAIILVLISMMLTLIAGIIPSGSAAKKDPVVALRSE